MKTKRKLRALTWLLSLPLALQSCGESVDSATKMIEGGDKQTTTVEVDGNNVELIETKTLTVPETIDDGDSQTIPDTSYTIASFSYNGKTKPILVSKAFKTAFPNGNPTPTDGTSSMESFQFFLFPDPIIEQSALTRGIENLTNWGELNGTPYFMMNLPIRFISMGAKEEAAAQINKTYPWAKVTARNFMLVPYRYLELKSSLNNETWTEFCSFPEKLTETSLRGKLANYPEEINCSMKGSKEYLTRFTERGQFRASFFTSGFKIEQNILNYFLTNMAQIGFFHLLDGQAAWQQLDELKSKIDSGTLGLGPLGGLSTQRAGASSNVTSKSWVTRNQVKNVVSIARTALKGGLWIEIQDSADQMAALEAKTVETLLALFTARDAEINAETRQIEDAEVRKDLAPDHITEINNQINAETDFMNNTDVKTNGQYGGAKGELDTKSHLKMVTKPDLKFKVVGDKVIPKSIRLYQVNSTVLDRLAQISHTQTRATKRSVHYENEVGRFMRIFAETQMIQVSDSKHDVWCGHVAGKGNEDLTSKGNKNTDYLIEVSNFNYNQDSRTISFHVLYRVSEREGDKTVLEAHIDHSLPIPVPDSYKLRESIPIGSFRAQSGVPLQALGVWSNTIVGGHHHFQEGTPGFGPVPISWFKVRGDADGRDDRGNCRISYSVNIPIEVYRNRPEFREAPNLGVILPTLEINQ